MRADRLLSLLILLQTRGRMTAQALAEELDVSARTIYRDIEALSYTGVPVYTERGPGGGCALLDSYRTNLTGLTESEIQALFMLSVPAPLSDLGMHADLKSALLKLTASLPAAGRLGEQYVRQRFYLDSVGWFHSDESVPNLETIQRAVWEDRKLHLTYRIPHPSNDQVQRQVEPYGLVAKAGVWYLMAYCNERIRVYRVSQILEARLSDEGFERPEAFDLARSWKAWCEEYERNQPRYPVTVRIAPDLLPLLPLYFGDRIRDQLAIVGMTDAEGWYTLTLQFERFETARARLMGFGRAVEVLEPEALRQSLIDFATQIVLFYREGESKDAVRSSSSIFANAQT